MLLQVVVLAIGKRQGPHHLHQLHAPSIGVVLADQRDELVVVDGVVDLLPGQRHQLVDGLIAELEVLTQQPPQGREFVIGHLVVGTHHLAEQRRRGELQARRLAAGAGLSLRQHLLEEPLDIG